jgi:predicted pyridoxine 5'-phosphate oxidase superfamily flavin-nucleotide-binding protein
MSGPEDAMFSPAVKAEQTRLGSRARFEGRDFKFEITDDLRQFLAAVDTFFFATASADGRPYVQHRGGPPGFLKPIGTHMLAFADFAGNRQYITLGHLKENDRAHIFIPHFATQQRVKLWGRARVVEGDLALMERLVEPPTRQSPSGRSSSPSKRGTPIAASTSCRATARPRLRPRSTSSPSGSRSWKKRSPA